MKKVFLLLTTYYLLLTTANAQNPVTAPEVRIPGKAQNQVRRIQKPMTGVLFYRLSDSTMCVRNPDNSVTPLSGGGSGDYSPWDTTATAIIQKDTTLNVGIGTVSPDFNLHVAGSFFAEKTVGGRTAHFAIDTLFGFMQSLWEWTSGDTSNVMGITPGDAFMRANTDGTDYDVILNLSDPKGTQIQGKDTATGNALVIFGGADNPFQGDTVAKFANAGTITFPDLAGSRTRYVTADEDGTLQAQNKYVYTAVLIQSGTSDPTITVLENTLGTVTIERSTTGVLTITNDSLNFYNTWINATARIISGGVPRDVSIDVSEDDPIATLTIYTNNTNTATDDNVIYLKIQTY